MIHNISDFRSNFKNNESTENEDGRRHRKAFENDDFLQAKQQRVIARKFCLSRRTEGSYFGTVVYIGYGWSHTKKIFTTGFSRTVVCIMTDVTKCTPCNACNIEYSKLRVKRNGMTLVHWKKFEAKTTANTLLLLPQPSYITVMVVVLIKRAVPRSLLKAFCFNLLLFLVVKIL